MRCPDCKKFAAYDDSEEPEVVVEFNEKTGDVTADVRIVLLHDECGSELKEASFQFEETIDESHLEKHRGEGHSLDVESEGEMTCRTEGSGRYMKTFYGAGVTLYLRCSCQPTDNSEAALWEQTFNDDIQASHMDELV